MLDGGVLLRRGTTVSQSAKDAQGPRLEDIGESK